MRLVLHGGFGEKGRTSLAIERDGYRLLLDAGVKTSARGSDDYYPRISDAQLRATDAILVTHGHEDHVAALGWCIARGFGGRIFMTPETRRDAESSLAGYATASEHRLVRAASIERLPLGDDALRLGPLSITTGRSGHIAGGVWCRVDDGRTRFNYCGDVIPSSAVFAMDAVPAGSVMAIDASYGDDTVRVEERARQVQHWIAAHPGGCVLPTPLYGRSAELLAIVPGPLALAPGMRVALEVQVRGTEWLRDGVAVALATRLREAGDWSEGDSLPHATLLCHDGMGMAGPARTILELARGTGHATLFTGHLPAGSPGERMVNERSASWIRLPTHPTLEENIAIAAASGASTLLGHSCDPPVLAALARRLPRLRTDVATGDTLEV